MYSVKTKVNGVDVEQLVETINAVEDHPELAHFTFRANTEWIDGARTRTKIQNFHGVGKESTSREQPLIMQGDEPPVLLGHNTAPNAVETVLHALASCLSVGFAYNAAAKDIEIDSLEFEVEGDLDLHAFLGLSDEKRPGYDNIKVKYWVETDAPREDVLELCEHVQKTSPVLDIISNPVPVTVTLAS